MILDGDTTSSVWIAAIAAFATLSAQLISLYKDSHDRERYKNEAQQNKDQNDRIEEKVNGSSDKALIAELQAKIQQLEGQ